MSFMMVSCPILNKCVHRWDVAYQTLLLTKCHCLLCTNSWWSMADQTILFSKQCAVSYCWIFWVCPVKLAVYLVDFIPANHPSYVLQYRWCSCVIDKRAKVQEKNVSWGNFELLSNESQICEPGDMKMNLSVFLEGVFEGFLNEHPHFVAFRWQLGLNNNSTAGLLLEICLSAEPLQSGKGLPWPATAHSHAFLQLVVPVFTLQQRNVANCRKKVVVEGLLLSNSGCFAANFTLPTLFNKDPSFQTKGCGLND